MFYARYVDDTFVVIDRDQQLTFNELLNAVFPDIQFTMEKEENNQLAFLHVLLCLNDCSGLKTNVFRKATNTMQCGNDADDVDTEDDDNDIDDEVCEDDDDDDEEEEEEEEEKEENVVDDWLDWKNVTSFPCKCRRRHFPSTE
nr:unnamed protein product [Spirometra erinaceieuropaei]